MTHPAAPEAVAPTLIDTDVHNMLGDLTPYLPRVWQDRWQQVGFGTGANWSNPRGVHRHDVTPPDGGPPGSDPLFLISDHLDRYDIDYAILTGPSVLPLGTDPDYSNAIASAFNDCTLDTWLTVTARFKGSILVNSDDPPAAGREIRRLGGRPEMVQVLMAAASRSPYGQRQYHPIYEAAAEFGLPVAIHPGTEGAGMAWPPTPVGYPSRYMEWHNILPLGYMAQINSLVTEGVFERFEDLRVVGVEGGLAWLPHLMWRMDKNYKALRDTAPWLKQLPSDYVKQHVVLTTQPTEEPDKPEYLAQILEMMDAARTVMFSSDYPHWDNDNPSVLFRRLDRRLRARILAGTAAEVYGLHEKPPRVTPSAAAPVRPDSGHIPTSHLGQVE